MKWMVSIFFKIILGLDCSVDDVSAKFFNIRLAANPDYYLMSDLDANLILEHKTNSWFDQRKTVFTFVKLTNETLAIQQASFDYQKLDDRYVSTHENIIFSNQPTDFKIQNSEADVSKFAYWEQNVNFDEITFRTIDGGHKTRYIGYNNDNEIYVYQKKFFNELGSIKACSFQANGKYLSADSEIVRGVNCFQHCENESLKLAARPSSNGKILRTFLTKSSYFLEEISENHDKLMFRPRKI